MKTILYDGEVWQAMPTGGGAVPNGYTLGVLFPRQTTGRAAFGRMRGIRLEDFEQANPDQLREGVVQ